MKTGEDTFGYDITPLRLELLIKLSSDLARVPHLISYPDIE